MIEVVKDRDAALEALSLASRPKTEEIGHHTMKAAATFQEAPMRDNAGEDSSDCGASSSEELDAPRTMRHCDQEEDEEEQNWLAVSTSSKDTDRDWMRWSMQTMASDNQQQPLTLEAWFDAGPEAGTASSTSSEEKRSEMLERLLAHQQAEEVAEKKEEPSESPIEMLPIMAPIMAPISAKSKIKISRKTKTVEPEAEPRRGATRSSSEVRKRPSPSTSSSRFRSPSPVPGRRASSGTRKSPCATKQERDVTVAATVASVARNARERTMKAKSTTTMGANQSSGRSPSAGAKPKNKVVAVEEERRGRSTEKTSRAQVVPTTTMTRGVKKTTFSENIKVQAPRKALGQRPVNSITTTTTKRSTSVPAKKRITTKNAATKVARAATLRSVR